MARNNYFEDIEKISSFTLAAVMIACGMDSAENITDIRKSCDTLVYKTESILFSDFLPPLERDTMAAIIHSLSRIIDIASDLINIPPSERAFVKANEEAKICVKLTKELCDNVTLLPKLKRSNELPDICRFRSILSEARSAHKSSLLTIRASSSQKSHAEAVALIGRLRMELSMAFDELIEIMLENI